MRKILNALSVLLLATPVTTMAAEDGRAPSASVIRKYQPARLVKIAGEWPGALDREALVYVEFNLDAKGKAFDVQVGDGGFHERRFTEAAMQVIRKAKFSPAVEDGVPVAALGQRMPVRFRLPQRSEGITPPFRQELLKVQDLLAGGDYAGGHFHAQWMLAEKTTSLYEYAALQAQLAKTHAAVGNVHRAIIASRAATERANPELESFALRQAVPPNDARNYLLPGDSITKLLELRMRLAASKGLLLDAIKAYYELAGLQQIADDSPLAVLAEKMIAMMESDRPMVGKILIDESKTWQHETFRNAFSIKNPRGSISELLLKCVGNSRILVYQPAVEWTIPASWSGCSLKITGEPGTEFDLVEYTAAAPPVNQ